MAEQQRGKELIKELEQKLDSFNPDERKEALLKLCEKVDAGERIIVGLNRFVMPEEEELDEQDIFEVDPEVEEIQKSKLAALKQRRDNPKVQHALEKLSEAIDRNENLMPSIIESVKSYATLGEISGVMRDKWGEFKAPTHI